mgnify:CR=1 FL=1
MLGLDDVAKELGKTVSGVRKLVAKRRIRYFQDGRHGRIKFKPEWVDEYIQKNTTPPQDDTDNPNIVMKQKPRQAKQVPSGVGDSQHGLDWDLMGG